MLIGCEKDDQQIRKKEGIQFLQRYFTMERFKDSFIKENLKVNWDVHTQEIDSVTNKITYGLETSLKGKLVNDKNQIPYKYEVLASQREKAWDFQLVRILANEDTSLDNVTYSRPNGFSGMMYFYDLKGENTKIQAYDNGEKVGEFNFQHDKDISNQKEPPVANNFVWIPIFIDRYIDWYNDRGGHYEYSHSVLYGTRMEYIAIGTGAPSNPYNQEQGNNYHEHHGGSVAPSNPVDNHPVEVINKLTGKAKCVYDKLESLNGNLFKETIGAFIDDPKYNLTLQLGNCSTTDDACTDSNDPMNIVITLEDVNQSSLGIAGLILHEAIHAEMHRYVSRFKSGVDPNNRARLFQLYKHYKDLELNTGEIQHIYMTENYIIPIAKALRSIDGNRYPMEYYKSFAWDGLRLWDANGLLSMEMDSIYYSYRNIVVNNSILGCD